MKGWIIGADGLDGPEPCFDSETGAPQVFTDFKAAQEELDFLQSYTRGGYCLIEIHIPDNDSDGDNDGDGDDKADAQRYRWLREYGPAAFMCQWDGLNTLDAAIDAKRSLK